MKFAGWEKKNVEKRLGKGRGKVGKLNERLEIAKRMVGKGSGESGKCRGKMGRQRKEGQVVESRGKKRMGKGRKKGGER